MASEPTRSDEAVENTNDPRASHTRGAIRDRRLAPRGTLPRQAQVWVMLGRAGLILRVILITGRPEPAPRVSTSATATPATTVQPERVRSLQQRFAEQETRAREAQTPVPITPVVTESPTVVSPA